LMDEDGRNTSWLGSNPYCLSPATACDGVDNPLPSANVKAAADLDDWLAQFAAQYFSTCRNTLKTHAPNLMYLGADTVGTWGAPARKEILTAASKSVDLLFTQWFTGQPDPLTSAAIYQYLTRYFGDKPLMNFMTLQANPDSALFQYPSASVFGTPTQEQRGLMYASQMSTLLSTPSFNGTYQWVGSTWWGLNDYWNEKMNWGLVSLSDNPYDGKSARPQAMTDPWGFKTGNEGKSYGDVTDLFKQANALWWYGVMTGIYR
jgi:hypothetical protein